MRILFVHPPYYILSGESAPGIPLGLLSLATLLITKGHEVLVYDADFERDRIRRNIKMDLVLFKNDYFKNLKNENLHILIKLKKIISDYNPDIIGVSFIVPESESAFRFAKFVRKINKEIILIAGGRMATALPEIVLKYYDIVVRGEGEITMLQLVNQLSKSKILGNSLRKIKGISYFNNGMIINNKDRSLIRNLSKLPLIKRELLFDYKYYSPQLFGYVSASRGCCFNCIFCTSASLWSRSVRFRKVDEFLSEIIFIKNKYGTREFHFIDDLFTFNKNWIIDFCRIIVKNRLNIKWHCITRADFLDDEMLKYMKKAGCLSISLGIESGSQKILNSLNKKLYLDTIKKCTNLIKSNGILVQYFLMMGYPRETDQSIKETFSLIDFLRPDFFSVGFLTPFPGSQLYKEMKKRKLIRTYTYSYYNLYFPVIKVKKLSFYKLIYYHNEFKKLSKKSEVSFYKSFFRDPSYLYYKFLENIRKPKYILRFVKDSIKLVFSKEEI